MLKFILKKIIIFFITMWLVASLTFIMMHCLPGEAFASGKAVPPQILKNLNTKYGLDKPLHDQYVIYLTNIVKGDLGISMFYKNRTVNSIIARAFPISLDLGIRAIVIAAIMGILLGMIAAFYKNKIPDYLTLFVALIGVSIPAFVIGTLFQYLVCYKLSDVLQNITGIEYRVFPITGWDSFRHRIIPSLALAFGVMGIIIKTMRSSMIEVMNQNYIVTARAKGLTERQTIQRHAFKNAVLPVISVLGPLITSIIMGSFVIENIFSIPGLGQYFVNSVKSKDYTMVLGLSVFTAFISITLNTLTDIFYMFVNPRIRIYKREK